MKVDSASGNSNSGSNSGPSGNDAPVVTPTVAEGGTPAPPGGETSSKLSAQPATKPEPSTDGGEGKTAKPVKKPDTTAKPVAEAVVIDPEVLKQLESQKKLKEKLILVLNNKEQQQKGRTASRAQGSPKQSWTVAYRYSACCGCSSETRAQRRSQTTGQPDGG